MSNGKYIAVIIIVALLNGMAIGFAIGVNRKPAPSKEHWSPWSRAVSAQALGYPFAGIVCLRTNKFRDATLIEVTGMYFKP